MSEPVFQAAAKPMGKSVVWDKESETANPEKKVFLGKVVTGILDGRDEWKDDEGKVHPIYRLKLDDGTYVSIWGTAMINTAMEEGNAGAPIAIGSIVRFTHQGMKPSPTKGRKPYHVVMVEFAPLAVSFSTATPVSKADEAGY